jgi:hypothetical protein
VVSYEDQVLHVSILLSGLLKRATGERIDKNIDKNFSLTSLTLSPHVFSGILLSLPFFPPYAVAGHGE